VFLLDTDTLIFMLRAHPGVAGRTRLQPSGAMRMSVISLAELLHGARKSKRTESELALARDLAVTIPVVEVDVATADVYAFVKARMETMGTRLDDLDILIASTAIRMGYTLVTHNLRHFERIDGLTVEDWTR